MSQPRAKTQTEQLLDAFVARLKKDFDRELAIELFPENPAQYRLNHACGAILVAYGKSTFAASESTDAVFQARSMSFQLTLVFRQLHGTSGAISYLDRIRECLTGWKPPHCDMTCRPTAENFIGQVQGLWQYGLSIATRAVQLQSMGLEDGPPLRKIRFEELP
ncbi:Gp37 protein [Pseudomonas sp. SJZ103]|uniref:Gp37 family protein n=1 Tax=unclassified Pseudomonas TaxID=196821 RepID=UPI00119D87A9|nr:MULTISPECIES: Gp37 family protein [unclassified Pseudomonas]TWC74404.1 Gp37 protein [Pseudomonas sp. SJZ103]TWC93467.1 Gp37 protein [Pseudomonas sp. SJZ094]